MRAMVLNEITNLHENRQPLRLLEIPDPFPDQGQIRVKISTCGVCHTELDEIEGGTAPPRFPAMLYS